MFYSTSHLEVQAGQPATLASIYKSIKSAPGKKPDVSEKIYKVL
jgi:hypothetical protein